MEKLCEICGSPIRPLSNTVEIDGAILQVCSSCAQLGRPLKGAEGRSLQFTPGQSALKGFSTQAVEPEYDVDPYYHVTVRQAREKLGLTHEALGRLINEKPSVIRLVETRRLKPDLVLTRKLMHHLKVNLLVPVSELDKRQRA